MVVKNGTVELGNYNDHELDESILWSQSADVGHGYQCIRPVTDIHLNLDAPYADGKYGDVKDGNELILFSWKRQKNQKWKMLPVNSQESVSAHHHHQPEVHFLDHVPEGRVVKIYCEQSSSFFLTVRNGEAVLAPGDENDATQHWIVVTERGNRIKDEAGFPAFALVSKATLKALKHGSEEWDRVELGNYNDLDIDKSILWSQSADVGHEYQCIRPVTDIHLNLDAQYADGKYGDVEDGNELILFSWKRQKNQKWKMLPVDCK